MGKRMPFDTDVVDVLENTLFCAVLAKMNENGVDVPSAEQIKSEYVKEELMISGIDETFEQYPLRYKELYEMNNALLAEKEGAITYHSAMICIENVVQNAFSRRDLKRAKAL